MDAKPYDHQGYIHEVPPPGLNRPPTDYKRFSHFSSYGWLLESLTLILSLVFFAGAVAILWFMNDQPLDKWTTSVSLNAVISILTTACGTLLMHGVGESISQHKWLYFRTAPRRLDTFKMIDQASRGASGSAKLILGSRWNLATFGAIISIARLAFSPLVQQVIQIEQKLVSSPGGEVTYGFTHEYARPNIGEGLGFVGGVPQDPLMQSAIMQGIFNISAPAIFSCPGVCSWDERTVSLGFKTECIDVTQETVDSQSCEEVDENGTSVRVCSMETPKGVPVQTREVSTSSGTTYVLNATASEMDSATSLLDDFPTFVHLAVYRASVDANFAISDPTVIQCSVAFTAYEYLVANANGSDFRFNEMKEVDFGDGGMQFKLNSDDFTNHLYFTDPSESKDLPKFVVSQHELLALQKFFTSSSVVSSWIEGSFDNTEFGLSAALQDKDVDIAERFEAMATSMTDYLRAGPNQQFREGTKQENVAFVTVRWYWLAGPAAIELGAVLFVLITMISNRSSRRVPLWKSSVTAVLNCEFEERTGMIHPREGDIRALEKRTKKTFARLE